MYKLMIVDDEETIRSGLIDLIPWGELGFEVTADFEDGQEAIAYLRHDDVDVVLTDIRMAEVGGLTLARYLHGEKPETKIVLISGYKEFEYAQQAIQYNVTHYLLKPTKIEEIAAVFTQIKQELDKRKEEEAGKRRTEEWLPILQEQFFTDLLMGALRDPRELQRRMEMIDLPVAATDGCCVIDVRLQAEPSEGHGRRERSQVVSSLSKWFLGHERRQIYYYPVHNRIQGFKVVAVRGRDLDAASGEAIVQAHLHKIRQSTKAVFGFEIRMSIESAYDSVRQLAASAEPLKLASRTTDGKLRLESGEYDKLIMKYKLFVSNMLEGNETEVASLLDRFLDEFRDVPISFTRRLVKDLFAIMQTTFAQGGVDIQDLTRMILENDMQSDNLEQIRSISKSALARVMNDTAPHKSHSSQSIIDKAKLYIQENYAKELSLESVADQVFLHPVYFSKLFKQYAGVNFTDYLTRTRMNKAIELLAQRKHKMYEISRMIGYANSKYFNRVFKQFTGCTPREYSRIHFGLAGMDRDE